MQSIVSIIVPTYNSAKTIKATIDSVISQRYKLWETILIDDGSTDNTLEILQYYSKQDQRIKFFKRISEPRGASSCRNIGIEKASGEFLVFLDSDDLLAPWCLEKRIDMMKTGSDLDFGVFRCLKFNYVIGDTTDYFGTDTGVDPMLRFLSHDLPWQTTCTIWKKGFLLDLKGFDIKYPRLNDPEFHTRALLKSKNYKTYFDLKEDCYYRIGEKFEKPSPEFINKHFISCLFYLQDMPEYINDSVLINDKDLYKSRLKTFLFKTVKSAIEWNQQQWAYKLLTEAKKIGIINSSQFLKMFIYINVHYLSYFTGLYKLNLFQNKTSAKDILCH
jgi:glycosyltransferase involved in cell wall biosynthesis